LKVLEKRPVTFFSRVFSILSIKPKRVPCLVAKYKFIRKGLKTGSGNTPKQALALVRAATSKSSRHPMTHLGQLL
jgi:hypothetical protein